MIIKNKDDLATAGLREKVLDIVEAGIARVLPPVIMETAVGYDSSRRILSVNGSDFPLSGGRLFVVGGGKASGLMAETLEKIIAPETITAGIVNCKGSADSYRTEKIRIIEAGHPVPDEYGLEGVRRMLALKEEYSIGRDDIVLCLISGGGSALMPCPVDSVGLEDKQKMTGLLLGSGADIREINSVRKHLSGTKGGGLGLYFSPATVVSLMISDVIGNDLEVIASGPTSPDSSTFHDAYGVLEKYGLVSKAPESVVSYLERGLSGRALETPKTLDNCRNFIIGDNRLALEAMADKAAALGLSACIVTAEQKGGTSEVARFRAKEVLGGKYPGCDILLIGGETTPRLPDNPGRGGRNQHFAAASMLEMRGCPGEWVIASVGTDGSDYLPEVAGAIVDSESLSAAERKGLDIESYLEKFDSNTFLKETGDSLVITGDTGTNVGDVIVYALKRG